MRSLIKSVLHVLKKVYFFETAPRYTNGVEVTEKRKGR